MLHDIGDQHHDAAAWAQQYELYRARSGVTVGTAPAGAMIYTSANLGLSR